MSKKASIYRILFITGVYFCLMATTACVSDSSASKTSLVPEPLLGKGIYILNGIDAPEGLIWSPNGEYLAGLIRTTPLPDCPPSPIFCLFHEKPHSEIFSVNTANWQRQTVLRTEYGTKNIYSISWFPGGDKIAYGADTGTVGDFGQVWSIDVDGQNDSLFLDQSGTPAWSPDGLRIAVASSVGGPGNWYPAIYLIDLSTGENQMVFKAAEPITDLSSLSWSPDGKLLAFSYGKIGVDTTLKPNIFCLDVANHKVIQMTDDQFEYWGAKFSPTGKLIALQRLDNGFSTVIKDLDKNCEVSLPIPYSLSASWSPDGQKLVVSGGRKAYIVNLSEFIGKSFGETGSVCQ